MVINSTLIIKNIIDNGFQLDPKALDLIKNLDNEEYVNNIIFKIINYKIKEKKERNITKKDLTTFLIQKNKKDDNLSELKIDNSYPRKQLQNS